MPLLIPSGGENSEWGEIKAESEKHLLDLLYQTYGAVSSEFRNIPPRNITTVDSLYVGQRECAVLPGTHADDGIAIVGSDDATTCHIVIVNHQASKTVAVAHFDGADTPSQVKTFLKRIVGVLEDVGAWRSLDAAPLCLDTWIVGGFEDRRALSERLSGELLWLLHTQPSSVSPAGTGSIQLRLKLACISKLNTVAGQRATSLTQNSDHCWPAIFGAAIDVRTGDVFPCTFDDRGPEAPLRSARNFSDQSDLLTIYDHNTKHFTIEPFAYYRIDQAEMILKLPDEWFLANMSTSPNIEPPHFASTVREMIKFTVENPDWQDVFKNGPIEYEKLPGQGWFRCTERDAGS